MEDNNRLPEFLRIGVFSLIILSFLSACDPEEMHEEAWSFNNRIGFNVDFTVYSGYDNESTFLNINHGDSLILLMNKGKSMGGVGPGFFLNKVDSAYLVFSSNDSIIAIWRESGLHSYGEGFEYLPDFFNSMEWASANALIEHSRNNLQYRYILKQNQD